MDKLLIFKIGGHIIDEPSILRKQLTDLSHYPGKKIIVHGGGSIASEIAMQLGIQPKIVDGKTIHDLPSIHVSTMVYAGLINKLIVSSLNCLGARSCGFTGADAFLYTGIKRTADDIDYGFVGEIDESRINSKFLRSVLDQGLIPVLAPLTADENGDLLKVDADHIASSIASALSEYYRTEIVTNLEKQRFHKEPSIEENPLYGMTAPGNINLLGNSGNRVSA